MGHSYWLQAAETWTQQRQGTYLYFLPLFFFYKSKEQHLSVFNWLEHWQKNTDFLKYKDIFHLIYRFILFSSLCDMLRFWFMVNSTGNSITHVHLQTDAQLASTWAIGSLKGLKDEKWKGMLSRKSLLWH